MAVSAVVKTFVWKGIIWPLCLNILIWFNTFLMHFKAMETDHSNTKNNNLFSHAAWKQLGTPTNPHYWVSSPISRSKKDIARKSNSHCMRIASSPLSSPPFSGHVDITRKKHFGAPALQNSNVESLHYRIKSKLWWGYMNVPSAKLTLKMDYLPCVCVHAPNSADFRQRHPEQLRKENQFPWTLSSQNSEIAITTTTQRKKNDNAKDDVFVFDTKQPNTM